MDNILKNINDEFRFSIHAFINGDMELESYTEDVSGETPDRFFERRFRYSFDGVNFGEWIQLSQENIKSIKGYSDKILFIDFLYVRRGIDTTGELIFNSMELNGGVILQINTYDATSESIFSEILKNNFYTQSVRMNLLRKVYNSGILPEFIERKKGYDEDADFVSFWTTICGFFALVATLAEEFDNIPFQSNKLRKYLEQYNIALHKDSTLEEMQVISQNILSHLRARGTILTTREKNESMSDLSKYMRSNGEFLRSISFDGRDDLIIDFERKKDNGYFLQQSSVIYPGTFRDNAQLEKYKGVHLNSAEIPEQVEENSTIKISEDVDYIFEVEIEKPVGVFRMDLGMAGFNPSGYKVNNSFKNCRNRSYSNFFLKEEMTTIKGAGRYVIRCVIFNKQHDYSEKADLNIGLGNNLRQMTNFMSAVLPIIICPPEISIVSINMRPLIKGWGIKRPKNPQFLQSTRFVNAYRYNNNNDKSEDDVNAFHEQYLIPYQYKLNAIELKFRKETGLDIEPVEPEIPIEEVKIFDNTFDNTLE